MELELVVVDINNTIAVVICTIALIVSLSFLISVNVVVAFTDRRECCTGSKLRTIRHCTIVVVRDVNFLLEYTLEASVSICESDTDLITTEIPLSAQELVSKAETLSLNSCVIICCSSRSINALSSSVVNE